MLKDVRIFHFHTFNLWIRVLYKASLRLGLRSELPIFALDVPFSTTRDDISLIAAENKFLPNHITMPQIRDSRFNLKHLNQIFMRGIFRHKKLLMTRTERVFFLKTLQGEASSSPSPLPTFATWQHTSPWKQVFFFSEHCYHSKACDLSPLGCCSGLSSAWYRG